MGVADGSVGLRAGRPKAPLGCSQVSSNPWEKGTLARWDSVGKAAGREESKAPGTCRPGRPPGGYLGLRARCRFKRLIEAFWQL